jgi:hypothetical protein
MLIASLTHHHPASKFCLVALVGYHLGLLLGLSMPAQTATMPMQSLAYAAPLPSATEAAKLTPAPTPTPPKLVLELVRPVARLTQAWPVQLQLTATTPGATACPPTEWVSRVVWRITQVGRGPVPLTPLVQTQTPSTLSVTPVALSPGKPLRTTINLRQYTPIQGAWLPGTYRIAAQLALCNSAGTPQWVTSNAPVYLDVVTR